MSWLIYMYVWREHQKFCRWTSQSIFSSRSVFHFHSSRLVLSPVCLIIPNFTVFLEIQNTHTYTLAGTRKYLRFLIVGFANKTASVQRDCGRCMWFYSIHVTLYHNRRHCGKNKNISIRNIIISVIISGVRFFFFVFG